MTDKDENNENKKNTFVKLFVATFIATFVFVALAVRYFSPDVDVEIGKNGAEETEEENSPKGSVDERLRWIQFEDNMPGVSTRFATNEENQVKDKSIEQEENVIEYDENISTKKVEKQPVVPTAEKKQEAVKPIAKEAPIPIVSTGVSKVYVGHYSTIEQAIAMQNRLSESELNLAPFVKKIGSFYVVQIGSYASVQKAQSVAAEVQNAGYAARVVSE